LARLVGIDLGTNYSVAAITKVLLSQIKTINIVKRGWILGKKVKQLNNDYRVLMRR